MLKSTDPINMEAYREAICGATEEERTSLARTVQPAKILGSEREAAQAPETLTSLGFYLLGALTSSPATAIRTWCTVGYISRTRCSANTHREHLGWFIAGLTERSDEWVLQLAAVEHDPWTEAQDAWEPVHTVLRNRHLVSESPSLPGAFDPHDSTDARQRGSIQTVQPPQANNSKSSSGQTRFCWSTTFGHFLEVRGCCAAGWVNVMPQ